MDTRRPAGRAGTRPAGPAGTRPGARTIQRCPECKRVLTETSGHAPDCTWNDDEDDAG